ncbi:hypothetical protein PLESTF_000986700 [Pleodorina starrii]|nr:hypothetical protein PLESTF_000986700 [Pleodorina starrii]
MYRGVVGGPPPPPALPHPYCVPPTAPNTHAQTRTNTHKHAQSHKHAQLIAQLDGARWGRCRKGHSKRNGFTLRPGRQPRQPRRLCGPRRGDGFTGRHTRALQQPLVRRRGAGGVNRPKSPPQVQRVDASCVVTNVHGYGFLLRTLGGCCRCVFASIHMLPAAATPAAATPADATPAAATPADATTTPATPAATTPATSTSARTRRRRHCRHRRRRGRKRHAHTAPLGCTTHRPQRGPVRPHPCLRRPLRIHLHRPATPNPQRSVAAAEDDVSTAFGPGNAGGCKVAVAGTLRGLHRQLHRHPTLPQLHRVVLLFLRRRRRLHRHRRRRRRLHHVVRLALERVAVAGASATRRCIGYDLRSPPRRRPGSSAQPARRRRRSSRRRRRRSRRRRRRLLLHRRSRRRRSRHRRRRHRRVLLLLVLLLVLLLLRSRRQRLEAG